jgi:beta-glucosidase
VAQVTRPLLELKDFTKVALAPGETTQVSFSLRASDFSYLDSELQPRLDNGVIRLFVGASARASDLDCIELTIADGPREA